MTVWFILDHSHKISRYYHQNVKPGIRDSSEIRVLELESWIISGVFFKIKYGVKTISSKYKHF